jgi:hypothetical protein
LADPTQHTKEAELPLCAFLSWKLFLDTGELDLVEKLKKNGY